MRSATQKFPRMREFSIFPDSLFVVFDYHFDYHFASQPTIRAHFASHFAYQRQNPQGTFFLLTVAAFSGELDPSSRDDYSCFMAP